MEFNVYIGYDEREDIAAQVCKFSIKKRTKIDEANLIFLKSQNIKEYTRSKEPNQSTDFTYTRFMIPFMEEYKGYSIFCDCDFLFQADIKDLIFSIDKSKAISVVKHPAYTPNSVLKMDGVVQHTMKRKNWASLIVFNNAHPSNHALTPLFVNTVTPGRRLHQFDWLDDNEIGSISLEWNTLDDYYFLAAPKAIHYTDGGPWFANYKDTMYSQKWKEEYDQYTNASTAQSTLF